MENNEIINEKNSNRKKFLLFLSMIIISTGLSSCAKKVECDVTERHLHKYINRKNGVTMYINSEKEYIGSYDRCDEYIEYNAKNRRIDKLGLAPINENIDYIYDMAEDKIGFIGTETLSPGGIWIPDTTYFHQINDNEVVHRNAYGELKVYKVNDDGTYNMTTVKNIDNIPYGYEYFCTYNPIVTSYSDPYYYMERGKIREKK